MLKSIAKPSPDLQAFIQSLNLPLNQAQEQHISRVADAMVTLDMQLTLRASTVRRLNKNREPGKRLTFRSKIDIAHQMLEAVAPFIPTDGRVYVQDLHEWLNHHRYCYNIHKGRPEHPTELRGHHERTERRLCEPCSGTYPDSSTTGKSTGTYGR